MAKGQPEQGANETIDALLKKLNVDKAQLNKWKAEYGKDGIFHVSHTYGGVTYDGIFRKPDFDAMSDAQKFLMPDMESNDKKTPKNIYKAGLIYLDACELAKDAGIEQIDEVKAAFCLRLAGLFKIEIAAIKNL